MKDEKGRNTRRNRIEKSKIETLEIAWNDRENCLRKAIKVEKSLANNKDFYRICKQ